MAMPHWKRVAGVFGLLLGAASVQAQDSAFQPGKSYVFEAPQTGEKLIEYIAGNSPFVFSAPHGGELELVGIEQRSKTNTSCPKGARIVVARDVGSREVALQVQKAFYATYKVYPHVVVAHVARRHVDLNRDEPAATCGNALMQQVWKQFHSWLDYAVKSATRDFGGALYVDMHTHGHKEKPRLELGYSLEAEQLRQLYEADVLAVKPPAARQDLWADYPKAQAHTLMNLPKLKSGQVTLKELLFGDLAFGTTVHEGGLPAVPSAQDAFPQPGDQYFEGGYNTQRYTSSDYPQAFGWQIEHNGRVLWKDSVDGTAKTLMEGMVQFMNQHTSIQWKK